MFGEANQSLHTTRLRVCELGNQAEGRVTLAWDAAFVLGWAGSALAVPSGSEVTVLCWQQNLPVKLQLSGSRNGGFSPPLLSSLSIPFPWNKAALDSLPGSSCRGELHLPVTSR